MRIIKATNYGTRTVIRVVLNPNDPEWVHTPGEPVRDRNGFPMLDGAGEFLLVSTPDVAPGETGETCHNCHYNWTVRETIFDGAEQDVEEEGGEFRRKTDEEFIAEVVARLLVAPLPEPMVAMVGQEV